MSQDALFPLPLTAFETYMLLDERPAYPMTFHLQLDVSGDLDQAAFTEAVGEAVGRHPLVQSIIRRVPKKGLCWQLVEGFETPISWDGDIPQTTDPAARQLDLTERPGIRLWVQRHERDACVTFLMHHAICDGIGVFEFVGDILAAYAQRTGEGDRRPALAAVNPDALRNRGDYPFEMPEPIGVGRLIWETLREALRWLLQRPKPLVVPAGAANAEATPPPFPGCLRHTFSAEETARLRETASQRKVTTNDILLRDMFLALARWNGQHGQSKPRHLLRINMPTGLRGPGHVDMPAANAMSYAFLTRRTRDCDDPTALLESVRAETDVIKRWHLGLFFLDGLRAMLRIPGLLRWIVSGNRCFSTVVLTNLGNTARRFRSRFPTESGKAVAGNVVVENLLGTPPVRPKTHAVFAISHYAGELHIWMRAYPDLFSHSAARQLLQCYVDQVRQSLDSG